MPASAHQRVELSSFTNSSRIGRVNRHDPRPRPAPALPCRQYCPQRCLVLLPVSFGFATRQRAVRSFCSSGRRKPTRGAGTAASSARSSAASRWSNCSIGACALDPHIHRHLWLNIKVLGADSKWSNLDSRVAMNLPTVVNAEGELAYHMDPAWIAAHLARARKRRPPLFASVGANLR